MGTLAGVSIAPSERLLLAGALSLDYGVKAVKLPLLVRPLILAPDPWPVMIWLSIANSRPYRRRLLSVMRSELTSARICFDALMKWAIVGIFSSTASYVIADSALATPSRSEEQKSELQSLMRNS